MVFTKKELLYADVFALMVLYFSLWLERVRGSAGVRMSDVGTSINLSGYQSDVSTPISNRVQLSYQPSKHGLCGPVLVSDWHIGLLAILAYRYANNYRHWPSLGKPISVKWCSANNLQYWSSLGKTIDRHYGNLYIW